MAPFAGVWRACRNTVPLMSSIIFDLLKLGNVVYFCIFFLEVMVVLVSGLFAR